MNEAVAQGCRWCHVYDTEVKDAAIVLRGSPVNFKLSTLVPHKEKSVDLKKVINTSDFASQTSATIPMKRKYIFFKLWTFPLEITSQHKMKRLCKAEYVILLPIQCGTKYI